MTDLTIEKMDVINFLLSEVALELLGNQFYDVYGVEHKTLGPLLSTEMTAPPPQYKERTCQLLNDISVSVLDVNEDTNFALPTKPAKRKRRASATEIMDSSKITNQEINLGTDPESLLVPMAAPSKKQTAGRISRRRFTMLDSGAAQKRATNQSKMSDSSSTALAASGKSAASAKLAASAKAATTASVRSQSPIFIAPAPVPPKRATVRNIVKKEQQECVTDLSKIIGKKMNRSEVVLDEKVAGLRERAEKEFQKLLEESQKERMSYFLTNRDLIGTAPYHSEFEIVEEFHSSENHRLMYVCNQLIEFIKFVKLDQDNSDRMGLIANIILKLKDTM